MEDFAGNPSTHGRLLVGADPIESDNLAPIDWDWFRVDLERDTVYELVAEGVPPGARINKQAVRFYNQNGKWLESLNSRTEVYQFSTPGFVERRFVGIVASEELAYRLSLREVDTEPDEFANATLANSQGNRYFTGKLNRVGDIDWFKVYLKANTTYTFHGLGTEAGHGTLDNPAMRAFDPAGNWLAGDNDSGKGLNARLTFTTADAGEYLLRMFAPGDQTGSYSVFSPEFDDWDSATGPVNGTVTSDGEPVIGSIDYPRDNDLFAFEVTPGEGFRIKADDARVVLLDSNKQPFIAANPRDLTFLPFDTTTKYFVRVEGRDLFDPNIGLGDYELTLSYWDVFPDEIGEGAEVSVSTPTTSFERVWASDYLRPGDVDSIPATLYGGGDYEFQVRSNDSVVPLNGDLTLIVYDPYHRPIARSEDGTLRLSNKYSGQHYVVVTGADGAVHGNYEVFARSYDRSYPANDRLAFVDDHAQWVGVSDASGSSVKDTDVRKIDLVGGERYLIFRNSFPESDDNLQTWRLLGPDRRDYEFKNRIDRGYRNAVEFVAPETGTYEIIENLENRRSEGGYQYDIYANPVPHVNLFGRLAIDSNRSLELGFETGISGDDVVLFEVISEQPLVYDGNALPADTLVNLTRAELELLELAGPSENAAFDIAIRAQFDDERWTGWHRTLVSVTNVPTTLTPDADTISRGELFFDFPDALPDYYAAGEIEGFEAVTGGQRGFAHRATGRWNSNLIKMLRYQPEDPNHARRSPDINIFQADIAEDVLAFAPGEGRGYDIIISSTSPVMQDMRPGTEGFYKMLRAVGMTLGFQEDNSISGQLSVMGMLSPGEAFPISPLADDVAALREAANTGFYSPRIRDEFALREGFLYFQNTGRFDASELDFPVSIDTRPGQISTIHRPGDPVQYMSTHFLASGTLTGTRFDDWLSGSAESMQTLNGGDGNDTLLGRQGDDDLIGGLGSDLYIYQPGDGRDRIIEEGSDVDVLQIDGYHNLTSLQDDFTFERLGNDMYVRLDWDGQNLISSGEVIQLQDMGDPNARVESLVLNMGNGSSQTISLVSIYDQIDETRQRFQVQTTSDAFGLMVQPV